MEFGLSFGAVGDFISIAVLIKDIITALDDARGSVKEYRELVQQLNTLSQTLDAIQQTLENHHLTHSIEGISGIALDTVAKTKNCLTGFLDKISKYESALGTGAPVQKPSLNSIRRKVQWKLHEKDVEKFHSEVMGYTMTLKVVFDVITVQVLQRNHDSLVRQQSASEGRTASLIRQSEASLQTFLEFIGQSIISKLEILYSLGIQLKITTCQIVSMVHGIAGDLNSIKAIVMRLDRGPSDEHFVLEDITGRVFPIHLKTITSWEILEFILSERFKGKKGARRVQHRRYTLRENKTHREINGSIPWDSAFFPYQKVNMSLICNEAEQNGTGGKLASSCPFCKTPPDRATPNEVEMEWKVHLHYYLMKWLTNLTFSQNCGRFFTRTFGLRRSGGKLDSACKSTLNRTWFTEGEQSKHLGPPTDYDSDDEDVQGFVRVHLISKKPIAIVRRVSDVPPHFIFKIKGLWDYTDSHKHDDWPRYAAACAKETFVRWDSTHHKPYRVEVFEGIKLPGTISYSKFEVWTIIA